jgi:hypothetical protein
MDWRWFGVREWANTKRWRGKPAATEATRGAARRCGRSKQRPYGRASSAGSYSGRQSRVSCGSISRRRGRTGETNWNAVCSPLVTTAPSSTGLPPDRAA